MAGQVNPDILTKGINDVRTVSGNIQTNGLTSEKLITAIKALETVQVGIGGGPRTPPGAPPPPIQPPLPSGSPPGGGATRKPSISMEKLMNMKMPGGGTFRNLRQIQAISRGPQLALTFDQKKLAELATEKLYENPNFQKATQIVPYVERQKGGRRRTAHRNQKRHRASTRKQSRRA